MARTEPLPLFYSLNRFIDHEACISAGSVEICRASFILDVVGDGAHSEVKRLVRMICKMISRMRMSKSFQIHT